MELKPSAWLDRDVCDQLAGVAGFGWTASLMGFLSTVLGYGNGIVARLVSDPQSLLYVGFALFLTMLGFDRLAGRLPDR